MQANAPARINLWQGFAPTAAPRGLSASAETAPGPDYVRAFFVQPSQPLVGPGVNKVTLKATVLARIKARFAGNGRVLAKKRNAESRQHSGSRGAH